MKYGYCRVSTKTQARDGNSLEDQKKKVMAEGAEIIFCDAFTGTKTDRPEFNKLNEVLKPGDTIIVTKLDRIARSAAKGAEMVDKWLNMGVIVHILNMGRIDDTPTGRLISNIFFAFAEFERDMIVERTQDGKAVAKQNPDFKEGRKEFNHPQLDEYLTMVHDGNITIAKACKKLGCSRNTFKKYFDKKYPKCEYNDECDYDCCAVCDSKFDCKDSCFESMEEDEIITCHGRREA